MASQRVCTHLGCLTGYHLKEDQTCYLTTPSLYAYLRLYKRKGCIYCMSSFTPPLLRGYHRGTDPWDQVPDGGAPLLWRVCRHTLTRGQTCYLITPSLLAYLRLYKRKGVIYCMSSFEHISGVEAPASTLCRGVSGHSDQGLGSQTPDLGVWTLLGGHPRGP